MWLMDPQSGRMEKVRRALDANDEYQLSLLFGDRILGTNWLMWEAQKSV